MAVTKPRQKQIKKSESYLDTMLPGLATMVTGSTDQESDMNALRSQSKLVKGTTNWYDDLSTINGKKRSISGLNTDLNTIETKHIIAFKQLLTDVTVGNGNNYVALNVTGLQAPSETAGVSGVGAVVSVLANGEYGSNRLTVVAGANALSPKNLVQIVDSTTKDSIKSGEHEIFGLIQAEDGVVQGDTFNDTDKRIQISFVINNGSDALVACPVSAIENKVIEYLYPDRVEFSNLPEDVSFPFVRFGESASSSDITLNQAISNQGASAVTQVTSVNLNMTDETLWNFRDSTGTDNILQVSASAVGDSVSVTGEFFSTESAQFDFIRQAIEVGSTQGTISTTGNLTFSNNGGDLTLDAGQEIFLDDQNKTASTYSGTFKLSDTSGEFDTFETNFGEVSLINALNQAYSNVTSFTVAVYEIDSSIAVNGNFAPSSHTLLSGTVPNWTTATLADAKIYLNGVRLVHGAAYDFEAGTIPANGDIEFNVALSIDDLLTIEYN